MPEIPLSPRAKEVPIPEMSPSMAGAPYAAVEHAARQVEADADYGTKVYRAIQGAEDHVATLKAENQINGDIEGIVESYAQRSDYNNFTGDIQQQTDDLLKKHHETLGSNERVWNHVEPFLGAKINSVKRAIEGKRLKLLTEDGEFQLDIAKDEASQQWAQATTGDEKEMASNEYLMKVQDAVSKHIISADKGFKREKEFYKKREEAEVILGLKSNDLSLISRTLGKIEANAYKNIDPKEMANFQTYGENREQVVKQKIDREQGELSVNAATGKLFSKWQSPEGTIDYAAAIRELHNPDFAKENGLVDKNGNPNRKWMNEIETDLRGREADNERVKREGTQKEADGVIKAIVGGQLGQASKLLKGSQFLKGTPEGLQLLNGIRTWGKRSDEDVGSHEDRAEYLRVQEMIDKGDYDEAKKTVVNTSHLKSGTAFALLNRLDTRQNKDVNHGMTTANKYLREQIAPSKGAFLPAIPEETAKAADAQQALQKWTLDENKKALEGKRIPVTTEEIFNKAKEMAPLYRMKIDEKVTAIKDSLKSGKPSLWQRMTGGGASQPSQADLEYTAKQHGITVDEVKKRLGVTSGNRSASPTDSTVYPP